MEAMDASGSQYIGPLSSPTRIVEAGKSSSKELFPGALHPYP